MSGITTHVLDTTKGRPAAGVPVVLEQMDPGGVWRAVGRGETDGDGRLRTLLTETPIPGTYRLIFDTRSYFARDGVAGFHPHVTIAFDVTEGESHYHVPLLLSAFGYSTYRGS
jgi:5-hydroxyisourate hydrolase